MGLKYAPISPWPALTRCWGFLDVERRPRRGGTCGEKVGPSFNPCSSCSNPRRANESKVSQVMTLHTTTGLDWSDERPEVLAMECP
ncbi:hypothetical protein Taro_044501 [Colocasia esculenta]|uniref:Uncharacterized protein n=1 Tax=Colocasia esculenta TaxID=4460 RepID=A0A843WJC4_COLES|nr:hypothetical protein [Colocasia esculenta]